MKKSELIQCREDIKEIVLINEDKDRDRLEKGLMNFQIDEILIKVFNAGMGRARELMVMSIAGPESQKDYARMDKEDKEGKDARRIKSKN